MKKLIYTLVLSTIVTLSGCNDFLEENPESYRDASKPFTSAAEGRAYVNNLYESGYTSNPMWQAGAYYPNDNYLDCYMTGLYDNVSYRGMNALTGGALSLTLSSSNHNTGLSSIWARMYQGITRDANTAIQKLPACPGLSDKERAQLIAEAKFFRALNYFYLVKHFGAVPILEKLIEDKNDPLIYPRRSSEAKVYAFIYKDLTDALNEGQLNDDPMNKNGFRVSKASVLALLADVCLNMAGYPLNDTQKYAEAAKYAEMLIDSPKHSLISSTDKGKNSVYNILRTSDDESEYLYQIEFNGTIRNAGRYSTWCFPAEFQKLAGLKYDITCDVLTPYPGLLNVYDKKDDLRYQDGQYFHTSFVNRSTGDTIPLSKNGTKYPFFFFDEESAIKTTLNGKDRVMYRLAEMYLLYAEASTIAEGAVNDKAINCLVAIKARATMSDKSKNDIAAELRLLSKDNFVKEVWKERYRELIFENKAWYDMTRTRKYPKLEDGGNATNFDFIDLIGAKTPKGAVYTEKNIYFPYPQSEIQRNPNLMADPL